ncbi:VWA domain-containing protein [Fulvimarina sp. 2208YS6-2-32]|uniref:VWA domain-containing protein n=1 Tax=Fulvimarina uroteuthidis TaxID=3098149 RepID=A0ABU5I3W4_9HYPH|nr:VWA domain-containing protein [Fulvimarina sp. 2208YS6-2-32]MDY8110072.1 VWA domain-containing protein [Fulvimarina sp. 2208YS6-2-32]
MVAISDIVLMRPWWLLALAALLALTFLALRRARGLGAWENAIDPALLLAMERFGRVVPGKARRILPPVGVAAVLIVALSGPATRIANPETFRNLDGLVVAIDLSRSIVEGGSLDDAQFAVQSVLENSVGRPVALIVYAGEAYVASAFTTDAAALSPMIAVLGDDIVPNPGSRTDRALALAARMFAEADILSGDVVVVTDGDQLTPQAFNTARDLASAGIHVDAFFVEPSAANGDLPVPDEAELRRLTELGDGGFSPATAPASLAASIGARAASTLAQGETAALFFRDYGRYLLVLALPFALLLFRRAT